MQDIDQYILTLGETVKRHRKQASLSQAKLAQYAGVGKTVIYDIEHGKPSVKLDTLLRVLNALNIRLEPTSPLLDEEGKHHASS